MTKRRRHKTQNLTQKAKVIMPNILRKYLLSFRVNYLGINLHYLILCIIVGNHKVFETYRLITIIVY